MVAIFLLLCRAGSTNIANGLPEALQQRATRILPYTEGNFTPSSPPALLERLTDHLLVVASDAVASATADVQPALSGKAKLRLLAWVVADARGATVPLEKALAETVGKRLERQAQKVRGETAAASARALQQRTDARSAVAADPLLAAGLASKLGAIDEEERRAFNRAVVEVYVGFHELEGLLPPSKGVVPEPAACSAIGAVSAVAPDISTTAAPAAATGTPDAGERIAPCNDVAARYDLSCELHKELVAVRAELHRTQEKLRCAQDDLEAERAATLRDEASVHAETLSVVRMLQDAIGGASWELKEARKRLRDPDEDNQYLETIFRDRSFIDRDEWLEVRQGMQRAYDESEAARPTEIYEDLALESWSELCKRAQDPLRRVEH